MADPERTFPDEFVPNIQGSSYHPKWVRSNPGEASKWEAYRDACIAHVGGDPVPAVPSLATKYGKALVAAGKEHVSVTDIGAALPAPEEPPPPSPTGTLTLNEDWADMSNPPWTWIFTSTANGSRAPADGLQTTSDGRVRVVTAPDGVGRALRTEMLDSDPGWPPSPTTDRSHIGASTTTTFGRPIAVGDIYYFDFELWLPLNNPAGEYFDYPLNQWYRLWEPHEQTGSRWSCFSLTSSGLPMNNAWMPLWLQGGDFNNPYPVAKYPLFQLTNSDGSWHTQNFNRRLHIRYGGRFAPDLSGWFEAFVDGQQVIPKTFHATMWIGDYGQYLQCGQYKANGDNFPHYGRSVVYYLKTTVERM